MSGSGFFKAGRALAVGAAVGAAVAGGVWLGRKQGELATRRPLNEWVFTHMNRVMPTEPIPSPTSSFGLEERGTLPPVWYEHEGITRTLGELHERTHTTSFMVVHRGKVLVEEYPGRFAAPGVRFQCYSLSKSITSMLIGIAVDRGEPRTALGGGSLNATTRDLARLGLLMANGGHAGSGPSAAQVVPEAWVSRSRGNDNPLLQVGALVAGGGYDHYGYSNQWWTLGDGVFTGLGVHGQYLWVDPARELVIVKTSAWNTADDEGRDRETVAAFRAISDALDA